MEDELPNRELYAVLHLSPDASDEDIRRAYRQWAQIYHPDKHRSQQMQDVATENFQRIREAYEILSDERKRQIYDIYGMEGLKSGLELGPKLKTREEVRRELERLQQRRQEQKLAAHIHHSGSLLVNLSLADALKSFDTGPIMTGMVSSTQVQAQLSKKDTLVFGGNILFRRGVGGGTLTTVLRRQTSPVSTVEVLVMVGLRSLLNFQTSRQLSAHATGTLGISVSLFDGSINVANTWTRQLSESTTGNIQLVVGPDSAIAVGWQRLGKQNSGTGELKLGPTTVGVTGQYIRHFSSLSQGRVTCKIGSTALEVEIGGERRVSEHSAFAMFCTVGIQGVSWRFRFSRGGQKFIIPVVLSSTFNPFVAAGALIIPSTLYAFLKVFVIKPYYLRRKQLKIREQRRLTNNQVLEARVTAEKAQSLLKNVADRKRIRQTDKGGLVILNAVYGNLCELDSSSQSSRQAQNGVETQEVDSPSPIMDVTIPLNFLVDDSGQLRLYEGVKKSGLMGFCDPCPGEAKQLKVLYTYQERQYEVVVGDYDELRIPQEAHRHLI